MDTYRGLLTFLQRKSINLQCATYFIVFTLLKSLQLFDFQMMTSSYLPFTVILTDQITTLQVFISSGLEIRQSFLAGRFDLISNLNLPFTCLSTFASNFFAEARIPDHAMLCRYLCYYFFYLLIDLIFMFISLNNLTFSS